MQTSSNLYLISKPHKGIFSSEAPFGVQVVSMKLNLSHVSRGAPQEKLLTFKHIGFQNIHVPYLIKNRAFV